MGFWKRILGGGSGREPLNQPASSDPPRKTAIEFPYPLEKCRGVFALARLDALRASDVAEGCTTVLLGSRDDVERIAEMMEHNNAQPEEYLRLAADVDPDWWVKRQVELDEETYNDVEQGEWSLKPSSRNDVVAHIDVVRERPHPEVYFTRIPTPNAWEAPAYLRLGNWNECPEAQYHVALAKRWHHRFGAEIVAATADTIEFDVARPPTTRDAARQLAWEHFVYCPDVVYQGVDTLNALASSLFNGRTWYFWWD